MAESRGRAPEESEARAAWDGCIRRRAREPIRRIAKNAGMSCLAMRMRLLDMHEDKRERIKHGGRRCAGRGDYFALNVSGDTLYGGRDGTDRTRRDATT